MKNVASESYRVLKKGKFCYTKGDISKKASSRALKQKIFETVGFKTKEIITKSNTTANNRFGKPTV